MSERAVEVWFDVHGGSCAQGNRALLVSVKLDIMKTHVVRGDNGASVSLSVEQAKDLVYDLQSVVNQVERMTGAER